jgi:hypothetical protein
MTPQNKGGQELKNKQTIEHYPKLIPKHSKNSLYVVSCY